MTQSSINFYRDLPAFSPFSQVTEPKHYRPVPADWILVITDVKGSTKAIEENRYKDVNMVGASSIVAILNALPDRSIPFVFGGDGATLLVHESDWPKTVEPLQATQLMASKAFGLDLRAGAVPVKDLIAAGADLEVARFQLSRKASLAMIKGRGVSLAEKWIKSTEFGSKYQVPNPQHAPAASFQGLSCRWSPVAAKRGEMMSLLVLARDEENTSATYSQILKDLENLLDTAHSLAPSLSPSLAPSLAPLLGLDRRSTQPIHSGNFANKANWRGLWSEAKLHHPGGPRSRQLLKWVGLALQVLAVKFSLATGVRLGDFHAPSYVSDLLANTDFQKFDGVLRMIREVSASEKARILDFLEQRRKDNQIYYGTHFSPQALMTCLVFSFEHHIHFVDGGEGGYTLAAKQLKSQIIPNHPKPSQIIPNHLKSMTCSEIEQMTRSRHRHSTSVAIRDVGPVRSDLGPVATALFRLRPSVVRANV